MNLEKEFLGESLTQTERLYLNGLTQHDGYKVLVKLMDEACRIATQDVMKLDPEEDKYESKLKARSQRARNIAEFSVAILKSIKGNIEVSKQFKENEDNDRTSPATN